jgi:hypothetical protein
MVDRLSREEIAARLRAACPVVLPSLLLCDFANLQREVEAVEAAGAATLHFDVIDGHFAPNITYGMPIIESVRRRCLTRVVDWVPWPAWPSIRPLRCRPSKRACHIATWSWR